MQWLSILWKAYLVAWIGIRIVDLLGKMLPVPTWTTVAYLALGVVGFVPVIGFILKKPFLRPIIWRTWLLFALCWGLFDLIYFAEWFAQHPLSVQIIGASLTIPSYLAVYVYSRTSNPAWAMQTAT